MTSGPTISAGEQGGQAGKSSAKRQIAEDTEWREVVEQLQVQQPVEQSASVSVVGRRSSVVSSQTFVAVFDLLTTDD